MTVFKLLLCHLIGDYVLQNQYLATTKGTNIYNLLVHCILYTIPFMIVFNFGFGKEFLILFISHFFIDITKARYKLIHYWQDQFLHYIVLFILLSIL